MAGSGYQVLARKWRPQRFQEVVGQGTVVRTLSNALDQRRVAHAYCFSGIRGVGKTTAARLLAKGLNCHGTEAPTSQPCGECASCQEIEESRSLDVIELDAASQTGVDNIRELTEVTRYAPSRDRYRVFIIDEAHMLSTAAFNALLKTLEEPPPHVVFILATTEPNKILPTVLSRCQHYPFGRISQREIGEQIQRIARAEGFTISEDAVALVAIAADGSLRDAQSLLDKLVAFAGEQIDEQTVVDLLGLVDRMLLFRAVDRIAQGDVPGVLDLVNEMVDSGVDLHQFTIDLLGHVRNLLVVKSVPDADGILHLPDADLERLRQQADQFGLEDLDRAFALVAGSEYRIKVAARPRYHLEVLLTRWARMPTLTPIQELLAALQRQPPPGGSPSGGAGSGRTRSRPRPPGRARKAAPATPTAAAPAGSSSAAPAGSSSAAPAGASPPVPATPATSTSPAEPMPADPPAAREPDPVGAGLLDRIQRQLEQTNPLIGNVLARASGILVQDQAVVFRFPDSAGIFADRVRDPRVLELVSAAAGHVLGRTVRAQVQTAGSPDPTADAGSPRPSSNGASVPAPEQAERNGAASSVDAAPGPPSDGADPVPNGPTDRDELRARVVQEPLVQEFVQALRGQITSVEEL